MFVRHPRPPRRPQPLGAPLARWSSVALLLALAVACGGRREAAENEAADGAPKPAAGAAEGSKGGEGVDAKSGEAGEEGSEKKGGTRVVLTEAGFATARILVEPARAELVSGGGGLEVPGQVEFDPARVALVSPRTAGRVERLLAVPGDRVAAGQTVALIQSPAFLTAQTDLAQAKRRRDLLAGTPDAEGAEALLAAARRRLELLGASAAMIARLEAGGAPDALLPVAAPFGGSIIEANALAGQAVEAGTPLYKIADLSAVNVAANVPERALAAVRVGQGATIAIPAAPAFRFAGRVTRIGDQLDPEARTAEALVRVANTNRALKPGMFATVTLNTGGTRIAGAPGAAPDAATAVSVPASAVVTDGDARYVFVEVGPRTYDRRAVELAPRATVGGGPAGARVVVASGLRPEERVVVRGAFTLKSELAKASLVDED